MQKPLHITFNKVNKLVKICNWIRYLELSDSYNEVYYGINFRIYNAIFDRADYLISKKNGITVLTIILWESELIHVILYR